MVVSGKILKLKKDCEKMAAAKIDESDIPMILSGVSAKYPKEMIVWLKRAGGNFAFYTLEEERDPLRRFKICFYGAAPEIAGEDCEKAATLMNGCQRIDFLRDCIRRIASDNHAITQFRAIVSAYVKDIERGDSEAECFGMQMKWGEALVSTEMHVSAGRKIFFTHCGRETCESATIAQAITTQRYREDLILPQYLRR